MLRKEGGRRRATGAVTDPLGQRGQVLEGVCTATVGALCCGQSAFAVRLVQTRNF